MTDHYRFAPWIDWTLDVVSELQEDLRAQRNARGRRRLLREAYEVPDWWARRFSGPLMSLPTDEALLLVTTTYADPTGNHAANRADSNPRPRLAAA